MRRAWYLFGICLLLGIVLLRAANYWPESFDWLTILSWAALFLAFAAAILCGIGYVWTVRGCRALAKRIRLNRLAR